MANSNIFKKLYLNFNEESLFPNDNNNPNIGELLLSMVIILSVVTLIFETEKSIYEDYKTLFITLELIFFYIQC